MKMICSRRTVALGVLHAITIQGAFLLGRKEAKKTAVRKITVTVRKMSGERILSLDEKTTLRELREVVCPLPTAEQLLSQPIGHFTKCAFFTADFAALDALDITLEALEQGLLKQGLSPRASEVEIMVFDSDPLTESEQLEILGDDNHRPLLGENKNEYVSEAERVRLRGVALAPIRELRKAVEKMLELELELELSPELFQWPCSTEIGEEDVMRMRNEIKKLETEASQKRLTTEARIDDLRYILYRDEPSSRTE